MYIKKEVSDFYNLREDSWSVAIDTLNRIEELGMEDELMQILEDTFAEETPTDTEVNYFLWFEDDTINELLGRNADSLYDDEENEEE